MIKGPAMKRYSTDIRETPCKTRFNTHVTTIDGEVTTLEKYAGKVRHLPAIASRCVA